MTRRLIADFTRTQHAKPPSADALEVLTGRGTEVLRLIGQGISNAEISGTLSTSGETTKTHVRRIIGKLGFRDRAQAVVADYESGLVTPSG